MRKLDMPLLVGLQWFLQQIFYVFCDFVSLSLAEVPDLSKIRITKVIDPNDCYI